MNLDLIKTFQELKAGRTIVDIFEQQGKCFVVYEDGKLAFQVNLNELGLDKDGNVAEEDFRGRLDDGMPEGLIDQALAEYKHLMETTDYNISAAWQQHQTKDYYTGMACGSSIILEMLRRMPIEEAMNFIRHLRMNATVIAESK